MTDKINIATLKELAGSGSKGFSLIHDNKPLNFFIIYQQGKLWAYLNHCPHTGINLEWKADEFLDSSGEYIQCATHGARFRIDDGYCVYGPCSGQSLKPVELSIKDGQIQLHRPRG